MPHRDRGIPIEGDIPLAPGAPGPGQGGPPAPTPTQRLAKQRARSLLRRGAGLEPRGGTQFRTGVPAAVEAQLNLQLAEGLISQSQFEQAIIKRTGGGRAPGTISEVAGRSTAATARESGDRRRSLRARARNLRARRAGLIAGATQAAGGPLGATPGLLPQVTNLFNRRQTF